MSLLYGIDMNLVEIKSKDLQESLLTPGDLYLKRSHSDPLLIKRAGDILTENNFQKYSGKDLLVDFQNTNYE